MTMLSKIVLALALAIAVILPTLIGTSFAQNSTRDCTTNYYGKGPC
jgi:hypothetical protein